MTACPLCRHSKVQFLSHSAWQENSHLRCSQCDLIYLRPNLRLNLEQERKRYETHNNDVNDSAYRDYLLKFVPALGELANKKILDFGCGPAKNLAFLLAEKGVRADSFDPIFGPPLRQPPPRYDFIFAIEVFEHFFDPRAELQNLESLLSEHGSLKAVTRFHEGPMHFQTWWYARDPTHVVFYSPQTVAWIGENFHDIGKKLIWQGS